MRFECSRATDIIGETVRRFYKMVRVNLRSLNMGIFTRCRLDQGTGLAALLSSARANFTHSESLGHETSQSSVTEVLAMVSVITIL